jgi:hypothetical protein
VKRGAVIGIVVGAVVVLAAGAGAVWWLTGRAASPTDAAQAYLEALAGGDGARAVALTDIDGAQRGAALDAYTDVQERITAPRVGKADEKGDDATVAVTYELQGDEVAASLSLRRAADRWVLTDALAAITPTTTIGTTVRIGGAEVGAGTAVTLLPGVYAVAPLPSGVLTGGIEVVAAPGAETAAAVEASVAPEATAAAQEQLDAYAQACAKPATAVPPHCGLKVPWGADLSSLKSIDFRIEKSPQITLAPDAASFGATGGVIVATARGTARSGGSGVFTYKADDWGLYGSVSFADGQMVLAVR